MIYYIQMSSNINTMNLSQIYDIYYKGFEYQIPEEPFNMLNDICKELGVIPLKNKTFLNKPKIVKNFKEFKTNIEQKTGIASNIAQIRMLLNKLTDKTFLDIKQKLIEQITDVVSQENVVLPDIANIIYDICVSNKFYSKIFAELFSELISKFEWINDVFKEKYSQILQQYDNIKYIDPNTDYDGFCETNKINEKRKSITTFYLNLGLINVININDVINILCHILSMIVQMCDKIEYKNEVDELTCHIDILFNNNVIKNILKTSNDYNVILYNNKVINNDINKISIIDTITCLSKLKTKEFPGLSSKSIFKFEELLSF